MVLTAESLYAIGPSARSRPPRSANDDARHLNSQLWYSNRTSNIGSERASERSSCDVAVGRSSRWAIGAAKRLCVDGYHLVWSWCQCDACVEETINRDRRCCVYSYSSSPSAAQGSPPRWPPRDILSRPTSHRRPSASDYAHHLSFPTIRRPPAKGSFII